MPLDTRLRPTAYSRERRQQIEAAKRRFLADGLGSAEGAPELGVRPTVLASWRRSALSGVNTVDYQQLQVPLGGRPGPLVHAAHPVLDRLEQELDGTGVWSFLVDRDCRLLHDPVGDREAVSRARERGALPGALFDEETSGTNGMGTALEENDAFVVVGPEHYCETLANLLTVGVPVHDPITRRLVGLVGLILYCDRANDMVVPYTRGLGATIETQLRDRSAQADRVLFDEFIAVRSRTNRPVAAFGPSLVLRDDAARALLTDGDEDLLRHAALETARAGRVRQAELPTGSRSSVRARCTPVHLGSRTVGVVVEFDPAFVRSRTSTGTAPQQRTRSGRVQPRTPAPGPATLVRGEPGSGKSSLLMAQSPEAVVVDVSRAARGGQEWLEQLREALSAAGVVILTHLHELPNDLVAEVRAALVAGSAVVHATATRDATTQELLRPVSGLFPDLVDMPALRERTSDLPELVTDILRSLGEPGTPRRCSPEVMAALLASSWPDNLRQLRQVLASAARRATGAVIEVDDLPEGLVEADPRRRLTRMERAERAALLAALAEARHDKEAAADLLGISRATVYRRLKHFGITGPTNATPDPT